MIERSLWWQLLLQKKMLLILILGFLSGLPLGLSGTALQAWYATEGVDIVTIGFLGLVGQPYVYKFIWSPFLDKYAPPYFGLRRGWLLISQLALVVILIAMAWLNPSAHPYQLAALALSLAFFSATQDIVIDAYRTELLLPLERGIGTAMAVLGYRIAMLVSAGFTLIIAHYISFSFSYLLMAALMGAGMILTLFAKEPPHYHQPSGNFLTSCILPFKEFLSRPCALTILLFLLFYKLGDAFAGSLTTAFLLKGVGFSLKEVGFTNKTVGLIATLLGVFCAGTLMIRLGLFRSLLWFGIIQALTNLLFLSLTFFGAHYVLMVITIFLENFGAGLGMAAFMAFIMSLCHPQYTATQFALLSSLTAVGRVYVGPLAGMLVDAVGWSEFFVWTFVFALPGLILLMRLSPVIHEYSAKQTKAAAVGA